MSGIDDFIAGLKPGILTLAQNTLSDFVTEAQRDAESLLDLARADIARWNELLAAGKLKAAEYQLLLQMQAATFGMHALTATGLAQVRIERFRKALISLVVDSATKLIPVI